MFGRLMLGNQLLSQAVQGVLLLAALLLPTIALGVQPGGLSPHVFQFQSQALPLFGERFLSLSEFVLSACQRLGGDAGGFQFRGPRFDQIDLPLEFTGSVVQLDLLLAEPQAGIALLVILLCRACIQGGFLSRKLCCRIRRCSDNSAACCCSWSAASASLLPAPASSNSGLGEGIWAARSIVTPWGGWKRGAIPL